MCSNKTKQRVICDTSIWYDIASGRLRKPKDVNLVGTLVSMVEFSSSAMVINDPALHQEAISRMLEGEIIILNPFDYICSNSDPEFPFGTDVGFEVLQVLYDFVNIDLKELTKLDEKLKDKIQTETNAFKQPMLDFANFSNSKLTGIRRNINTTTGTNQHLSLDTSELIKEHLKADLDNYLKIKDYKMDFQGFDWSQTELFLKVTGRYFKQLETTKGMKAHVNDIVDRFNTLYVTPEDKFATSDNRWRKYFTGDISRYLYEW